MPNQGDRGEPIVQVRDLRMRYGSNDVLDGVDLHVDRGEVLCLLGPNGAGKTTTIEILEGFRARSGGEVDVLGSDPEQAGEQWRARVGVVLQSWRDHPRWTPRRLLTHLGRYYVPYSTPERPRPYDIEELIGMVALDELAEAKIATLSGGQRRRLDVAIGIIGRPELLFLDEPTAGFDPLARRDFHDLIHRLSDLEPDAAAALEVGGSWRPLMTVAVLGAWAAVSLLLTPVVLRRMARRQSGSAVEAARQAAVQTIR